MFDGALPVAVDAPSPRVAGRAGRHPAHRARRRGDLSRQLRPREAGERLTRLYRPYHAALAGAGRGNTRPLRRRGRDRLPFHAVGRGGSRHRAGRPLRRLGLAGADRARRTGLRAQAFTVARNVPYAGGYHHPALWPARDAGVHALQIEINRALYLDEERIAPGRASPTCARASARRWRSSPRLRLEALAGSRRRVRCPGPPNDGARQRRLHRQSAKEKWPLPRERPSSGRKRPGRAAASQRGSPQCRAATIWQTSPLAASAKWKPTARKNPKLFSIRIRDISASRTHTHRSVCRLVVQRSKTAPATIPRAS